VREQCRLLGLNRSGLYYRESAGKRAGEDEQVMRVIDEEYTAEPTHGVEGMTAVLQRIGYRIGHNRVRRLMRQQGLMAVYPKPHLSGAGKEHRVYPYLLRGVEIRRPNQVWSTDITYIRLRQGFVYLVAVMDWYSRYVLSWELSTTMDAAFCVEALRGALELGNPEVFNTDQGSQFTSEEFTGVLLGAGVEISMDGQGRVFDNIFIERLWRTVKWEHVYLHEYGNVVELRAGLAAFFKRYNERRLHQALGYATPMEVYRGIRQVPEAA
jgi:putative transposase